jgi:FdhD protein
MREIDVLDGHLEPQTLRIPIERPLTLFVDRHELVTLMTLGQHPEWLALGYLLNQRLIDDVREIESASVDWDSGAVALRTHVGISQLQQRTARRIVTTGCGQGTVFEEAMSDIHARRLPEPAQSRLALEDLHLALETMRQQPSVHRQAGSVHGTALFRGPELLFFVEDVGRHNAVDTVAGWMAMQAVPGHDKLLCTTGRLTSEMVMKAAILGIPVLVSRNGATAMGLDLARRVGMTLIGRASGGGARRLIVYLGAERLAAT